MSSGYLIFELSFATKKSDLVSIERNIRNKLKSSNKKKFKKIQDLEEVISSLDIFFPFRELKKGKYQPKYKDYFFSGYSFIEYNSSIDYICLENSQYIDCFLRKNDLNTLEILPYSEILKEKKKMENYFSNNFRVGQLVEIVDGDYSSLLARVISEKDENKYKVVIFTRSKIWKLELHNDYLKVRDEDLIFQDDADSLSDLEF